MKKDINGKKQLQDALDDKSLPVCWKGPKPFKSVSDVKNYFKPLALVFKNAKNVQFQLQPEAYLIITVSCTSNFDYVLKELEVEKAKLTLYFFQKQGNACLGVLNGTESGLGNSNVIGGKHGKKTPILVFFLTFLH